MTNKRFTSQRTDDYNFSDILDNGKWIGICHVDCEDDFVNKFNELVEENEQLKQSYKEFEDECQSTFNAMSRKQNDLYRKNFKLKEENEQLKSSDTITDLETEIMKLKQENEQLKQQFILLLKKLGKKNVQCSFCEHGEHYSELVDGYYEPRFICHKKGQEYTQRSFCEDWKIMVKE